MKRTTPLIVLLTCILAAAAAPAIAAAERLTPAGLFSPELTTGLRAPAAAWLDSGLVLLFDVRVPPAERALELYDPATKTEKTLLASAAFAGGLRPFLGEAAPAAVSWPAAFSPSGDVLLYEIEGDVFSWEAAGAKWRRLTDTPAEETAAALSPDGRWVSFIRGSDIYGVERATGREVRLTWGGTETLLNGPLSWVYWEEIYGHAAVPYAWSPDSRSIAYLQTDDSPVSVSTFVNYEPATQGVVRQRYPKAGQRNPKVSLMVVDLASGRSVRMDCGSYEYLARFNWLPDGRSVAAQTLNRQQNHLRLFFADAATGESRLVLEENQPAWIDLNTALHFFKDGRRFLWMSERDGYQHLYLYDIGGRLVRQLTRGEFMVVSADGDATSRNKGLVAVDEKGGWVYFTSNKDALPERHLYRVKLDGSGLARLSREPGIHATSFSPSMRWYLDNHSSAATPPELVLREADGKPAAVIAPPVAGVFAKYGLGRAEFLTYRADDGTECTLRMKKPADIDPSCKYPAIVYVYGGPGSQEVLNEWAYILWNDLLVQEGYIVFSVEVRAGQNKSKALETGVYRQAYGAQSVADITAAVRRIREFPYVDGARLGLWGGSGGGCTTLFTTTHSDIFKAAIALYPVSDWHYYDTIYTERYQDTPQRNPKGYEDTSSVLAAKNLKSRLLIIHGTYDDNVHPQNTEAFIHELILANIPVEVMIYPWQKHGIEARPDSIHHFALMLDFWKHHL